MPSIFDAVEPSRASGEAARSTTADVLRAALEDELRSQRAQTVDQFRSTLSRKRAKIGSNFSGASQKGAWPELSIRWVLPSQRLA